MKCHAKLLERMKGGGGLVVYGVDETNSDATGYVDAICHSLVDCPKFSISQRLTEIQSADLICQILANIEAARTLVRKRQPFIFLVHTPLEILAAARGDVFQDDLMLDRICAADALVSLSRSDVFVVPNANSSLEVAPSNTVPLTPIEQELRDALSRLNLLFKEQVRIGRFTADFVVSEGEASVVVEADGTEFHDAEVDEARDEEIQSYTGYDTLRFTGSKIFIDADACAREVKDHLGKLATEKSEYRYENLQQLDPSQQEAVTFGFGHARVLAPAGSGKTRVLVNRVAYLLNSGVSPGSLVAIAFNRKAARQLEDRLSLLGIPIAHNLTDRSGVVVATFNALGYRLLMSNGFEGRVLSSDFRVRRLVRAALAKAGVQLPTVRGTDNLDRVIRQLARVCRGLVNPNSEQLELAAPKGETVKLAFPPIYTAIRDIQSEQRQITFDDQIFEAVKLALAETVVRRDIQKRFQYVLVDEYQDLNKAQISLVRILTAGNAHVFAVGDDDQLIYSWREAKTQHLLEDFGRFFPHSTTFALETNYRCAQKIVDVSQRLIAHNSNRFPKTIEPSPSAPTGEVFVGGYDSIRHQSRQLISFLRHHHKPDVCDWIDMAVLTRTKVQLIEVARALDEAQIPRSNLPKIPLYSAPIGRLLQRYLNVVRSPKTASGEDFATVINRPNRYVTNDFRNRLYNSETPTTLLKDYVENAFPEKEKYRANPVSSFLKDIENLNTRIKGWSCFEAVSAVISSFDLSAVNNDGQSAALDEADDEGILEVIAEESRRFEKLDEFLQHFELQIRRETDDEDDDQEEPDDKAGFSGDNEQDGSRDVIALNTIHATKGKEWILCCIFDARDAAPREAKTTNISAADDEEERRVFYVAMTRARRALGITTRTSRPSPFIREAFVSQEIEKAGISALKSAVLGKQEELAQRKITKGRLLTQIHDVNDKAIFLQSDEYYAQVEAQLKEAERERDQLADDISRWRARIPDGLLRRTFVGGFSMRDIEGRISDLDQKKRKLDERIEEISKPLSKAHIEHELEKLKLHTEALQIEADLCDTQIATSEMALKDAKGMLEVFELFQSS